MAALSIPMVEAEARKTISPHLSLFRRSAERRFEWVFDDGTKRTAQPVPTDKIRGLKMDQWLAYAKALANDETLANAPAPISSVPPPKEEQPRELMPEFMLIRKAKAIPFDPDPEVQGYKDAIRGMTACPYGLPDQREKWNRGHDRAYEEGLTEKPRFGRFARKRN